MYSQYLDTGDLIIFNSLIFNKNFVHADIYY